MSSPFRVLLLDDHPLILEGFAGHLEGQGVTVVDRSLDPASALKVIAREELDAAIFDIRVNGSFTFDLAAEALRLKPSLRVIFITGFDDDAFIEQGFKCGARGFALKSDPPEELTRALSTVMEGRRYVSPSLLKRFPSIKDDDKGPVVTTRLGSLTPREREVLKLVSAGRSAKEISRQLKISTWTVTNHKANIMAKLDIHNQVGLTRFAVSTGLVALP